MDASATNTHHFFSPVCSFYRAHTKIAVFASTAAISVALLSIALLSVGLLGFFKQIKLEVSLCSLMVGLGSVGTVSELTLCIGGFGFLFYLKLDSHEIERRQRQRGAGIANGLRPAQPIPVPIHETVSLMEVTSSPPLHHIQELTIDLGVLSAPPKINSTIPHHIRFTFPNVERLHFIFTISPDVDPTKRWKPDFSELKGFFAPDAANSTPLHFVFDIV